MSATPPPPAPTWSPRQRQLLAALGLRVLRRHSAATPAGISIEGDAEALQGPIGMAILRVLGLDPALAAQGRTEPGRLRLHWPRGSGSLQLPPLPVLRSAAGKRALWPQLRRLLRSRLAA